MFVTSLYQFVNQALKDIARSKFEHQIVDNLSGFLEEFANRPDFEGFKLKIDEALNKSDNLDYQEQGSSGPKYGVYNAKEEGETVAEDAVNGADTGNQNVSPVVFYILIGVGIILLIVAVAVFVIYGLQRKDQAAPVRKLAQVVSIPDIQTGRKLLKAAKGVVAQHLKGRLIL